MCSHGEDAVPPARPRLAAGILRGKGNQHQRRERACLENTQAFMTMKFPIGTITIAPIAPKI